MLSFDLQVRILSDWLVVSLPNLKLSYVEVFASVLMREYHTHE